VPHEPRPRGRYGGSFMEVPEWWRRPRRRTRLGEFAVMAKEILLLHGVWAHNRALWRWTFPFHLGLYLLAAAVGLWLAGGIVGAFALARLDGALGAAARPVLVALGAGGFALGGVGAFRPAPPPPDVAGAAGLHRRPPICFNLAFFRGGVRGRTRHHRPERSRRRGARWPSPSASVRSTSCRRRGRGCRRVLPVTSVLLLGALVAYVPLTHMSQSWGSSSRTRDPLERRGAPRGRAARGGDRRCSARSELGRAARRGGGRATGGRCPGPPRELPP
jgi:hypothetical protein